MLSKEELKNLLSDMESDRIERTISTNNTDKFCEAICAFSNDFPNHKIPSYLIIGVDDKTGKIAGINVDDALLKNLGGIRDDGNILPKPAITVQKYNFPEGDIVIVEVFPCLFPPVRYKGRVWIRNGPRKAIAGETEEKILTEKRAANVVSFDSSPAIGSSLDDINVELFKNSYLPNAIDAETLAANHRSLKHQLGSLRLYDVVRDCPTNAAILILGTNPKYFIPGAYIQYVHYAGNGLEADILNEHEFSGDLISLMQQLDLFVKNNIENRSVKVSPLKEEIVREYPFKAIRELLNNAIMHRSYESNAPIKFYQFNDRIEISNAGGLFGQARPDNFPHQNDYRNPVIAEALKIMGYVNRFNRGIAIAKNELTSNGNPEPDFQFDQPLHFGVKIFKKIQQ